MASGSSFATDWPDDLARALAGLRAQAPDSASVVVVADGPSLEQATALEELEAAPRGRGPATEVVWTSERLGHAAAPNAGMRRALTPVVVLLDTSVEPTGEWSTPLVRALADPRSRSSGAGGSSRPTCAGSRTRRPVTRTRSRATRWHSGAKTLSERGPLDERFLLLSQPRYLVEPRPARRGGGPVVSARGSLELRSCRHEHRG